MGDEEAAKVKVWADHIVAVSDRKPEPSVALAIGKAMVDGGFEVLNEVKLNQVMVSFGDAERTHQVIAALHQDGTAWCGGTQWHGRAAMRINFSSHATRDDDVHRTLDAIIRLARFNSVPKIMAMFLSVQNYSNET